MILSFARRKQVFGIVGVGALLLPACRQAGKARVGLSDFKNFVFGARIWKRSL
tara:strand:- start:2541 stop:2699 length:159 start_codon:yes stop_codon:yes gene_type:complete